MSEASPERVRELADEALAHADAARATLEDLLAAVERLRVALVERSEDVAPEDSPIALDAARLVAIEMAVAGHGREEVGRHLHETYGGPDVEEVLDDVFGDPGERRGVSSI